MSKRPTNDQLHALSDDQARSLLWQLIGYLHNDRRLPEALAACYKSVTDTSRAPLTVRCLTCPYVEAAYNEGAAERRRQDHIHPVTIEINPPLPDPSHT